MAMLPALRTFLDSFAGAKKLTLSGLPSPSDAEESLTPRALVVRGAAVRKEPRLFRPQEFPEVVLATGALVEALRGSGFSGLSFVEPSQWRP